MGRDWNGTREADRHQIPRRRPNEARRHAASCLPLSEKDSRTWTRTTATRPGRSPPCGRLGSALIHRLQDLGLDLALKGRSSDRPDELEDQLSVALDDERLGHAVNAPVDAGAVVPVQTHLGVGIALSP